jgi:inner membrane protein
MAETETPPRESLSAPAKKLVVVGAVLALLMVPSLLIGGLIGEREGRQREVGQEIARSWGPPQVVTSPVLVVPWQAPSAQPGSPPRQGELVLPPSNLGAEAELAPGTRRRGLFSAVVYAARLRFSGQFQFQRLRVTQVPDAELRWQEAYLTLGATGLRFGGTRPEMRWGEEQPPAEETPASFGQCSRRASLRWHAGLDAEPAPGARIPFDLRMGLRGTSELLLVPSAGTSRVTMRGAWPTPSFVGADLPERTDVTREAFSAEWRGGSGQVVPVQGVGCQLDNSQAVGVQLLDAVPTYRMVNRASKYALFFLALAFVTCGCFEMLARVRVHAVQSALLGVSVVMFPLLLLALGEAVGFAAAFVLTAAAVVVQSGAYVGAVTRRRGLGLAMGGVLSGLFGFLYVVLSLEAFSLLVGTLVLFVVLSVVMAVTRRVEWGR